MQAPERITLVLRAPEGSTLEQVIPFALLGAHVSIGRGLAVIAGASEGDLQECLSQKLQELGREREDHYEAMRYCERALGMHPLLGAHAGEMHALLQLINVKVGGLRAVCDHGGDPSDQMWEEFDVALDAIWPLLETMAPALADENVIQPESRFDIDEHVRMVADAKRYRWLRDMAGHTPSGFAPAVRDASGLGLSRTGEDLDNRVDAAIKAWPFAEQERQP
jgi:hypothetical protein